MKRWALLIALLCLVTAAGGLIILARRGNAFDPALHRLSWRSLPPRSFLGSHGSSDIYPFSGFNGCMSADAAIGSIATSVFKGKTPPARDRVYHFSGDQLRVSVGLDNRSVPSVAAQLPALVRLCRPFHRRVTASAEVLSVRTSIRPSSDLGWPGAVAYQSKVSTTNGTATGSLTVLLPAGNSVAVLSLDSPHPIGQAQIERIILPAISYAKAGLITANRIDPTVLRPSPLRSRMAAPVGEWIELRAPVRDGPFMTRTGSPGYIRTWVAGNFQLTVGLIAEPSAQQAAADLRHAEADRVSRIALPGLPHVAATAFSNGSEENDTATFTDGRYVEYVSVASDGPSPRSVFATEVAREHQALTSYP